MSGRHGYNLVHQLFKGVEPNTNIVNVLVYCKKKELEPRKKQFEKAKYPIEIRFVVENEWDNLKETLQDLRKKALNGTFE